MTQKHIYINIKFNYERGLRPLFILAILNYREWRNYEKRNIKKINYNIFYYNNINELFINIKSICRSRDRR